VKVTQDDVPLYSEWIGTTDGMVNADIKGQVTGYLLRQDYKEGSFVKKGEVLFEIDPRPFKAVLDQANGQLAQFHGQLERRPDIRAAEDNLVAQRALVSAAKRAFSRPSV
jgi:multidrug efflux pump subunit AcrA (membrane-fusion protein)